MTEQTTQTTETCPACGSPKPEKGICCAFSRVPDTESIPLMAHLVMAGSGAKIPINQRWIRIGRDEANQVVLREDAYASRYHAWVTFEADSFWVEDLGSTNGTLLNGEPLDSREILVSGDTIKIGDTELIFELHEELS